MFVEAVQNLRRDWWYSGVWYGVGDLGQLWTSITVATSSYPWNSRLVTAVVSGMQPTAVAVIMGGGYFGRKASLEVVSSGSTRLLDWVLTSRDGL